MKILKWIVITLIVILLGGWVYNYYASKDFLKDAILHIEEYPKSLEVINFEDYGFQGFQDEYYISINPQEFDKLLIGRKYDKGVVGSNSTCNFQAVSPVGKSFPAVSCYTYGVLGKEQVQIFTNADHSKAYIIYDVD